MPNNDSAFALIACNNVTVLCLFAAVTILSVVFETQLLFLPHIVSMDLRDILLLSIMDIQQACML